MHVPAQSCSRILYWSQVLDSDGDGAIVGCSVGSALGLRPTWSSGHANIHILCIYIYIHMSIHIYIKRYSHPGVDRI